MFSAFQKKNIYSKTVFSIPSTFSLLSDCLSKVEISPLLLLRASHFISTIFNFSGIVICFYLYLFDSLVNNTIYFFFSLKITKIDNYYLLCIYSMLSIVSTTTIYYLLCICSMLSIASTTTIYYSLIYILFIAEFLISATNTIGSYIQSDNILYFVKYPCTLLPSLFFSVHFCSVYYSSNIYNHPPISTDKSYDVNNIINVYIVDDKKKENNNDDDVNNIITIVDDKK